MRRGSILACGIACGIRACRILERLAPLPLFRMIALPVALLRAAMERPPRSRPEDMPTWYSANFRTRIFLQLDRMLLCFPDRLGSARWQRRCAWTGRDRLEQARRENHPVVLAMCHAGPVFLLHHWLRAVGMVCVPLLAGKSADRPLWKRWRDRRALFPEVPAVLYLDQLREVAATFDLGRIPLLAVDFDSGRQVEIEAGPRLRFRMATGALRLAARHGAEVFPCAIRDTGGWRFHIEIGDPVPGELLHADDGQRSAALHLGNELLRMLRPTPEQWQPELWACLREIPASPR